MAECSTERMITYLIPHVRETRYTCGDVIHSYYILHCQPSVSRPRDALSGSRVQQK